MTYKILIVEDEPTMLMGLRDNLEIEGYDVDTAEDGKIGLEKILKDEHHLVLLDVMLPEISGFDVCKKARNQGIETPIILLTAKGEEIDKVLGLELGADDYITKPFSLRELLARIKAILRRAAKESKPDSPLTKIGNLEVHFQNYEAFQHDEPVKLSHKEFEFLKYLYENPNRVVSRDEILDKVWGIDYMPSPRTVDNFILKLRHLIEEDSNHPKMILTVHGVGYKFVRGG
jgi:DNA-binding response OmpR family regulator